jgi:hypothetical protein
MRPRRRTVPKGIVVLLAAVPLAAGALDAGDA